MLSSLVQLNNKEIRGPMRMKRPLPQWPISTGTKFPPMSPMSHFTSSSQKVLSSAEKTCLKYGKTICNFYKNPVGIVMVMLTSMIWWDCNYSPECYVAINL